MTDEELRQGVRITVPGRANGVAARLKEGESIPGEADSLASELRLEVGTEFYFEERELSAAFCAFITYPLKSA